jgi:hypothetical protein
MSTQTTFLESVEALSAAMRKTATHLAGCLQATKPTHSAYAVLHRLERICYDTSVQFEHLLSPEVRAQLANIDERPHRSVILLH